MNQFSTSFINYWRKFLLSAYRNGKNLNRSPLGIPWTTNLLALLAAIIFCYVSANIYLGNLYNSSLNMIEDNPVIKRNISRNNLEEQLKRLIPNDYHKAINARNIDNNLEKDLEIIAHDTITIRELYIFLTSDNEEIRNSLSLEEIKKTIVGDFSRSLFIPIFRSGYFSDILNNALGIEEVNPKNLTLRSEEYKYLISFRLLEEFREKLGNTYASPRRLLQALGDYIQFITYIVSIWCLFILILRYGWVHLQMRFIKNGHLFKGESANIWQSVYDSKTGDSSLKVQYRKKYGKIFPFLMLVEALNKNSKEQEKEKLSEDFIEEVVMSMQSEVERNDYYLIDYQLYAIPSLGFIGTILGIIGAMSNTPLILSATGSLEMGEAFTKVAGFLGVAFDTTFISLFWALMLSLLYALVKQAEANHFRLLIEKGKLFSTKKEKYV